MERTRPLNNSFQCTICLEQAKDPVVTCCGHLFCWPCIYRWLAVGHSGVRKCPVCKGYVIMHDIIPINRRREVNQNPQTSLNIPPRPEAQRVDGWRQAFRRAGFPVTREETIRRFLLELDQLTPAVHPHNTAITADSQELSNTNNTLLLPQMLTSRGMRHEQGNIISTNYFAPYNVAAAAADTQVSDSSQSSDGMSIFASTFSSVEQLVGGEWRNQEIASQVDHFWNIAAAEMVDSNDLTHDSVAEALDSDAVGLPNKIS